MLSIHLAALEYSCFAGEEKKIRHRKFSNLPLVTWLERG